MWARRPLCLIAVAAQIATTAEARAARTLRICTTPEPGFNELTDAAVAKYIASGELNPTLQSPKISVGERGLLVSESDMRGYMHEQRQLMFTGKNGMGQSFSVEDGNLWKGDTYSLHVYPSYPALLYYTRTGFCQIGWGPVTVKASRESCSPLHCPDVNETKNTASLAPEVTKPVVALGDVKASMSCCIDFPQTTCSTGMAIAFRKFVKQYWYE